MHTLLHNTSYKYSLVLTDVFIRGNSVSCFHLEDNVLDLDWALGSVIKIVVAPGLYLSPKATKTKTQPGLNVSAEIQRLRLYYLLFCVMSEASSGPVQGMY